MNTPTSTWLVSQILVEGADAGQRARVREVLRAHRILALTADDEILEFRLATDPLGTVAVAGEDGRGQAGVSFAAVVQDVATAAPDAQVYLDQFGDGLVPLGEEAEEDAGEELDEEDLAEFLSQAGPDEELVLHPSVVLTSASIEDVIMEATTLGRMHVIRQDGWLAVLRDDPFYFFSGDTSTTLSATMYEDGLHLELISADGHRVWAPRRFTALSLAEVDVHHGAAADFLDRYVGLGAFLRELAREVPHLVPGQMRRALEAHGEGQLDKLVAAMRLPAEVAGMLRRGRTAETVPGAVEVAPTSLIDAAMETFAWEITGDSGAAGIMTPLRVMYLDKPWLTAVYSAAVGIGGIAALAGALRRARRGGGTTGSATLGVVGALALVEAVGEPFVQRSIQRRAQRIRG